MAFFVVRTKRNFDSCPQFCFSTFQPQCGHRNTTPRNISSFLRYEPFRSCTIIGHFSDGKYSVQEGGLLIRNVTHLDAGTYTCRAFETTSESSVSGSKTIDLKVKREYIVNPVECRDYCDV